MGGFVMSGDDLLDLLIRQRQKFVLVHQVSLRPGLADRLFRRPAKGHGAARQTVAWIVGRGDLFNLLVVELEQLFFVH